MKRLDKALELCRLADIPDGGGKEFYPGGEPLFAVRRDRKVFVYRNSCPHTGMPLNWQPDQFFDVEKQFIQCAIHAAIFQPDTGLCVAGPCNGESLDAIACEVRAGLVFIERPGAVATAAPASSDRVAAKARRQFRSRIVDGEPVASKNVALTLPVE